jgi:hypothetical protein
MKTPNTNTDPSSARLQCMPTTLGYRPWAVRVGIPLRVWVTARLAFGAILAVVGALVLTYDPDRWVGLVMLAGAAVSFWLGYMAIAGARHESSRI